jgi:hypothetical protein
VKTVLSLGFSFNFQALFDDLMLDAGEAGTPCSKRAKDAPPD